MNSQVYIVSCPDYDQVDEKMDKLISMMGGMNQFVEPNEKIVLKANLLQPAKPEQAVTTHPGIVAAVARKVKKEGAFPVIADSPGTGYRYNEKTLDTLYRACGLYEAAEAAGAELNFDTTYKPVSFLQGKLIKHFDVITPVIAANGVLNLCKLKTHTFMSMTGAVKNNFGVIPGLAKPGYHAKLHDKHHFADMMLDLAEFVSPRVSIMDAVMGMEGDGPGAAGTPRQIGLLLGSRNPLALDVIASEIIGLRPGQNPLLIAAAARGLGPVGIGEIEVIGAEISEIRISDYKFPATIDEGTGFSGHLAWWQKPMEPFIKDWLSLAPQIVRKKCVACGICLESCPMNTIRIIESKRKYAHIDDKQCIRCYCCHELCPEGAIELRQSFVHRLLGIGAS